jgi:hypothetical protein
MKIGLSQATDETKEAPVGAPLCSLRAADHCSFDFVGEPVKVLVQAPVHVPLDRVCGQIAN